MRAYWTETRPNGKPIEPGTVCRVIDLEDNTNPIYVYGRDQAEVLEKIERQNAHAQVALSQARRQPVSQSANQIAVLPQARQISPDQVMQATADLSNPAKAGEAITTLLEAHTGVDIRQTAEEGFARRAMEWERDTPEFFAHAGNRQLVGSRARALAGGNAAAITKAHLTQAFEELLAQGMLFEGEQPPARNDNPPPTPSALPEETPVQRERPRGTRFATGADGLRLGVVDRQPGRGRFVPKYTREQIERMPLAKSRELNRTNDKDYAEACEHWFGNQAMA